MFWILLLGSFMVFLVLSSKELKKAELDMENKYFNNVSEDTEQVTAHFKWSEFACYEDIGGGRKRRVDVPDEYRSNVKRLAKNLEVLRGRLLGKGIIINSGYRTPLHNSRVNGVSNSQHLTANAVDLRVNGYTPEKLFDIMQELIAKGEMQDGGIGIYDGFIHYDLRGRKVRWGKYLGKNL